MDSLAKYRSLVKQLLTNYAKAVNQSSDSNLATQVIFDDKNGNYMLFKSGWWQDQRIRSATVYVRLHNGKIWIEEDWTEDGIATELLNAGVPENKIVLAFHHPELRPLTEFAVA